MDEEKFGQAQHGISLRPCFGARLHWALGAPIAAISLACSLPNQPAAPVAPDWQKLGIGETTQVVEESNRPLTVNWKSWQRTNLQTAMLTQLAVASYTAKSGFKLLEDCRVDGQYGFLPNDEQTDTIKLDSEREVRTNLALTSFAIPAELQAELNRGASLDVVVKTVGKRTTTWKDVTRGDLRGSCTDATHFVRAAHIGALTVRSVQKEHKAIDAKVFTAQAKGASNDESVVVSEAGDLHKCSGITRDANEPPEGCGVVVRLELSRIRENADPKGSEGAASDHGLDRHCPKGLVYSSGKCTLSNPNTVHVCDWEDAADCRVQCERGDVESCYAMGTIYSEGRLIAVDGARAASYFSIACEKGDACGCTRLGYAFGQGSVFAKDATKAMQYFQRACADGCAEGCMQAASLSYFGQDVPRNKAMAARLFEKSCRGGEQTACISVALMMLVGDAAEAGLANDDVAMARYFKQACDGQVANGCTFLGYLYETGRGVSRSAESAGVLAQKACTLNHHECFSLARLNQIGKGVPRDSSKAHQLFQQSCRANQVYACVALDVLWNEHYPLTPEYVQTIASQGAATHCERGLASQCTALGLLAQAVGNRELAVRLAGRGCFLEDEWGCYLLQTFQAPVPTTLPAMPTAAEFAAALVPSPAVAATSDHAQPHSAERAPGRAKTSH